MKGPWPAQWLCQSIAHLLLVLEPMNLNLCIFSVILLGILYVFFEAFSLMYSNIYNLSS
ncbi:hypothetical protein BO82DRAFT_285101 [Aspergillus uvarum CBS 121591]|uniref:Uncharacterized protein n=1 Tax=Aspergillus uvarum CBS 121591 TaxID=1448315 RepID=A0A319CQJ8_9EURO|nr:hypothetical protein BO82DRAFT_285101 [Aspergillus uvarum CBS 121591]PYH81063.1 hypothetical protein BO82DRAFT_285101 [Aspergillus uvarum CBS 121591]